MMSRLGVVLSVLAGLVFTGMAARVGAFIYTSASEQERKGIENQAKNDVGFAPFKAPPLSRPLFRPQKTDPDLESVTDDITGSTNHPRLVGIVVDEEKKTAILSVDGLNRRVVVGAQIGPWTVVQIEHRSMVLKKDGNYEKIQLDQLKSSNKP